jgi:hypothetical protein
MPVEIRKEKPLCFVISQIGAENSPERVRADKVLRHVVEKALDSKYQIERADEIGKPGVITVQIIERLAAAELVVADLTGGNPNVYYELALRHHFAKPVVHIIERGAVAPFDVNPMRYVEYDLKDPDVLDAARKEVVTQVEAMEKGEKVVTLIQLAGLLEKPEVEEGQPELLKGIYAAIGNLQQSVENVVARMGGIEVLGQELHLVGSAVEEVSEMVNELLPATTIQPFAGIRHFPGLGRTRFRWQGLPAMPPANAARAGSGSTTETTAGPIGPVKGGTGKTEKDNESK